MADEDITFTLAVQACLRSNLFKLTLNLFSTLYTGWINEQNIPNIEEMFIPCNYGDVMKKVLKKMKETGDIKEGTNKLTIPETIRSAIRLLNGRPITAEECQYTTEILVAVDLYNGQPPGLASNRAFRNGMRKFEPEKRPNDSVLLPDGMFGKIGNQVDYTDMKSTTHPLTGPLELYKQEIDSLKLSEKIPSIRVIYPHNNYGIAMMRTIVLQTCKGRILGMIDDDDISCGLDSLHRIGKTMIDNGKYVAETTSWWGDIWSKATIGVGMWERVFDAQALKRFGIGFCPTFSHGEDDVFLMILRMLFADKFIKVATDGSIINGMTYPENIDLKYLYLMPSKSWDKSSIAVTSEIQKEEISVYVVQLCKRLGIYDALSKAIPSTYKCNGTISRCDGYTFIHVADDLESTSIVSAGDVICPVYLYKLDGRDMVKDGDPNVRYIWAMPSPEIEDKITFNTNILADNAIKENVIKYKLGEIIKYDDEGNLVVTGNLHPRSSSIDNNTGTVSYNGDESASWIAWNNKIYDELIAELNDQRFINARTKLRGGANKSYIILILLALALLLLIIIPIICKCVSNKNNSIPLSNGVSIGYDHN